MKNFAIRPSAIAASLIMLALATTPCAALVVDSITGAVTANEISNFKTTMNGWSTPSGTSGNDWLFTAPQFECIGMIQMYQITGDIDFLNKLIVFSDSNMAGRNDPSTGVVCWTGNRELVWFNTATPTAPAYTSCESGEHINLILSCARLILETPSIWNTTIPSGDSHGYGTTYKARALKYLELCDQTIDTFIVPIWVSAAHSNHIYAPTDWNGDGGANGGPVAWNRISMFLAALQRSSECHEILGNEPDRVAYQDSVVASNVSWFQSFCVPYTVSGHACYNWFYRSDTTSKYEEVWENHGALDIRMICEAYSRGIGLSQAEMVKYANTMQYSVWNGSIFHGRFDGADGSYGTQTHTKGRYTQLGDFLPALYTTVANANKTQTSDINAITEIFWMKNRIYRQFQVSGTASSGTSVSPGGSAKYDITVSPLGGFTGTVALTASGLPTGASASYSPSSITNASGTSVLTISTTNATPTGTYNVTITGTSGAKVQNSTVPLTIPSGGATAGNLAVGKTASASTVWSGTYDAAKAIDANTGTRWSAASDQLDNQWLVVDFGSTTRFASVVIKEIYAARVTAFKLQSSTNGVTFTDIPGTAGTTIGASKTISFEPVSARYIRLYMMSASDEPTINEFEVYANLAQGRTVSASSIWSASYDAAKGTDGSTGSRWSAASGSTANQWILVDLGTATSYSRVVIKEISFARVTAFKIQSSTNGTSFSDISGASGTTIGANKTVTFGAVSTRYVRLFLTSASDVPTINEFEVYTN